MKLVNMHKGKKNFVVLFKGIESHSSLTENGVNAIDYCGELINYLKNLQKIFIKTKNHQKFDPPYPTINIGKIQGGLAVNIIPEQCELEFEIRDTPNLKTERIIEDIKIFVNPKASLFLIGTQMDYQEGTLESGFRFINPNEKGRCGCGESFHV